VPDENTELWVEVSNLKNCSTTEKIAIEILPLPPVKITGSQAICAGSELTLTASGAESYIWNTGFVGSVYTVQPKSGNEYEVTGVDKYGCQATASTGVIVDKPAVSINVNPKIIWDNASDVHFETVTNIREYKVIWDFGDGIWSSLPEVDHHYHITGNEPQFDVVFSIVDNNGCVDTIRETVSVDIHPATVFFPNLNQIFMGDCEVCQNIEIYDRTGVKLYEGASGWDGTYKGRVLDPDTYFYVITLKFDMGGTNIRKGYITVGKNNRTK
jgi:gliding motility-associated-like protein